MDTDLLGFFCWLKSLLQRTTFDGKWWALFRTYGPLPGQSYFEIQKAILLDRQVKMGSFGAQMADLEDEIIDVTSAAGIERSETVQSLWSGYGQINRYHLRGGKYPSVIVKHIQWPRESNHPKGWNTQISHQRKLKSYQVETTWYQHFSRQTNEACRVPKIYLCLERDAEVLLVMEDLDASGFGGRLNPQSVSLADAKNCLSWLATFHAKFMGMNPEGLWSIGTYWHLDTRPDEWHQMRNYDLKHAAAAIDQVLNNAQFKTIVHGDAKLANFCFGGSGKVAAVDFQYIGQGCGMKDVAYFISSCFDEAYCETHEKELLNHYFNVLEEKYDNSLDFQLVKKEWSALYKYAWADLYRFLDGWSPGHWKMHDYSANLTRQVINELSKK